MTVSAALGQDSDQHRFGREFSGFVLVIAWAVLSYAAAFRSFGVGRDYIEYLAFYERIPVFLSTSVQRFELGFSFLAWFFRYVVNVDYGWFALVIVATALGIKFFLFWKYLKYPVLAAIYYCITFYAIHEYTQIRTAIALSFGYLAMHLFYKRSYAFGAICLFIGVSFHTSIIVLLPVYIFAIYAKRYFFWVAVALGVLVVVGTSLPLRDIALQLFSSANPLLDAYAENREMLEISIFSINNLGLLVALLLGVAAGWYHESRYHALFLIMSFGAILAVVGLAGVPMVAQRTKEVFYVATVFLAHRSSFRIKALPAIGALWLTGGLLFYLNLQSDVLGG